MEERRTAAWVLGIIFLFLIFFTVLLPKERYQGIQTLSFRTCNVHFQYFDKAYDRDVYNTSQNKVGLCLCNLYRQKPDNVLKKQIIHIYRQYGNHYAYDSTLINNNIDSIIKHKSVVLDTVFVVE